MSSRCEMSTDSRRAGFAPSESSAHQTHLFAGRCVSRPAKLGRMNAFPGSRPWWLAAGIGTAVLVEGVSDQRAVEALAARRNRDLDAEGVVVVAMGGATNIAHFLDLFGPAGANLRLAGLCDAGQVRGFLRALERAGFGSRLTRTDLERLGFFVCDADLEDELIRALGAEVVERVIEERGELGSLRVLQSQPAHRGRTRDQQLHRFLGTRSGRKAQYAALLVDALDSAHVPAPLQRLLDII